jgi:hypothetical protein
MTARATPNDAMRLVLYRIQGHGRDSKQIDGGPHWITGCPTENHIAPVVRWDQHPNGKVSVHACVHGCTPEQILAGLTLDDPRVRAYSPNGQDPFTGPARVRSTTGPPGDGLAIYEKLKAALDDGYDDGRARTGRYQCPACGARGDGHGLKVDYDPNRSRRILLICHSTRCSVDEILEPLGMTKAELCADDDTDDLGEEEASPAGEAEGEGSPEAHLPPTLADELEADLQLAHEVREQRRRLRAREILAELEQLKRPRPAPDAGTLAEILARPVTTKWRIDGLLPSGGRMLLSAQRKTGKTTATGNLHRSLLTGEPFLDRFDVVKLDGRIVALNYEMTSEQYAAWMDAIGVPPDRLYVVNLRGRRNLLADQEGRDELAEMIRTHEGEVLTVDPFGRAFTGKSQNDSAEVTPWLLRLDDLAEHAGVAELVLTAHAGWEGERTRGSSALEDWPDAILTMTRDLETNERLIKAEGRDVDLEEDQLDYHDASRRLTLTGAGNRRQVRAGVQLETLVGYVVEIVKAQPGLNTTELTVELRKRGAHMQREHPGQAARLAVERGLIRREKGPKNARVHFAADYAGSVLAFPSSPESSPGTLVRALLR